MSKTSLFAAALVLAALALFAAACSDLEVNRLQRPPAAPEATAESPSILADSATPADGNVPVGAIDTDSAQALFLPEAVLGDTGLQVITVRWAGGMQVRFGPSGEFIEPMGPLPDSMVRMGITVYCYDPTQPVGSTRSTGQNTGDGADLPEATGEIAISRDFSGDPITGTCFFGVYAECPPGRVRCWSAIQPYPENEEWLACGRVFLRVNDSREMELPLVFGENLVAEGIPGSHEYFGWGINFRRLSDISD